MTFLICFDSFWTTMTKVTSVRNSKKMFQKVAIRTVAVWTVVIRTVAILTVAILTVAILTVAIRTVFSKNMKILCSNCVQFFLPWEQHLLFCSL
jgi:hypothetical protein